MNQNRNQALPDGIQRDHILAAIREYDAQGMPPGYNPSHTYDVQHEGKTYPPPAIVALAAKNLTGALPEPGFRAGKGTKCFRILKEGGFEVTRKSDES